MTTERSAQPSRLQIHLPRLPHEIDAKAVMLRLRDLLEPRALIDAARGDQNALRPQRHLAIAPLARAADALLDQRTADAEPARLLLQAEQPQLCDAVAAIDEEDRADPLAVDLGDPAMLARGIEILDELPADHQEFR